MLTLLTFTATGQFQKFEFLPRTKKHPGRLLRTKQIILKDGLDEEDLE